jgi:uncharacterized protein
MKAKVAEDADVVTYVVVCDPGDEAVAALAEFVRAERLEAAQVTAIGAFERATVGWFDRAAAQDDAGGVLHSEGPAVRDRR